MGTGDAQRTIRIFSLFSPLREPKKMEWVSLVFALSIRTRVLWPAKEKLHKERTKRAKKPANRHVSIAAILKEKKEGHASLWCGIWEFYTRLPRTINERLDLASFFFISFYFFFSFFILFLFCFVLINLFFRSFINVSIQIFLLI